MRNNYLLVHGSFGSPFSNWLPYLRKEIENKGGGRFILQIFQQELVIKITKTGLNF